MESDEIVIISILGMLILSSLEKKFMPHFIQMKLSFIELLYDWRFYLAIILLLTSISVIAVYFAKRKKMRLEKEKIDDKRYWRGVKERSEAINKETEYQIPKKRINEEHLETPVERKTIAPKKEINVDLDRNFYRKKELNEDEIDFLLTHEGYHRFEARSLVSGKREEFILKPRFNEHLNHLFFTYDIMKFLKKKGLVANTYTTRMPDVVFILNGKNYAVEVETGTVMTNPKKFKEKIKNLNENYKDRWFFVPTNKNLVPKYRKYGKTVDPRCISKFLERLLKNHRICLPKKSGGKSVHRR